MSCKPLAKSPRSTSLLGNRVNVMLAKLLPVFKRVTGARALEPPAAGDVPGHPSLQSRNELLHRSSLQKMLRCGLNIDPAARLGMASGHASKTSTALVILVLVPGLAFSPLQGLGHSWYPHDCCHDQDCRPADSVNKDHRGDWSVQVSGIRIWVPKHFDIRASPDDRAHICYRKDEELGYLPLCLFLPPES